MASSCDLATRHLPPLISVGLPVFNGGEFIAATIDSLLNQTCTRWTLLVSDNGSQDDTVDIVTKYIARDDRIRLVRQIENKGAIANFNFVATNAHTPYFMWLAADDILEKSFIESCLFRLSKNPEIGMAFCCIRNIDHLDREVRTYPHLVKLSGSSSFLTVLRFLLSPEIMGKANLIYSVYRIAVCKNALRRSPFNNAWGTDMSFVLGALVGGGGIDISQDVLFNKRHVVPGDAVEKVIPVHIPTAIQEQSCPLAFFPEYMAATLEAVEGTRFWLLAWLVLTYRHYQLKKIEEARLLDEAKTFKINNKPPEKGKREGPWMARTNKLLRKLKLKKAAS